MRGVKPSSPLRPARAAVSVYSLPRPPWLPDDRAKVGLWSLEGCLAEGHAHPLASAEKTLPSFETDSSLRFFARHLG
jgi:hypothetical protein